MLFDILVCEPLRYQTTTENQPIFLARIFRCGLIKDWKERYCASKLRQTETRCGLIKDWKERYYAAIQKINTHSCGLIKDWKERY